MGKKIKNITFNEDGTVDPMNAEVTSKHFVRWNPEDSQRVVEIHFVSKTPFHDKDLDGLFSGTSLTEPIIKAGGDTYEYKTFKRRSRGKARRPLTNPTLIVDGGRRMKGYSTGKKAARKK